MGKGFEIMEEYKGYGFPLVIVMILSGQYEDDVDNAESVVYIYIYIVHIKKPSKK